MIHIKIICQYATLYGKRINHYTLPIPFIKIGNLKRNINDRIGQISFLRSQSIGVSTDGTNWSNPGYYEIELPFANNFSNGKLVIDITMFNYSDNAVIKGQIALFVMKTSIPVSSISLYGDKACITNIKKIIKNNTVFIRLETKTSYYNSGYINIFPLPDLSQTFKEYKFKYYHNAILPAEGENVSF